MRHLKTFRAGAEQFNAPAHAQESSSALEDAQNTNLIAVDAQNIIFFS